MIIKFRGDKLDYGLYHIVSYCDNPYTLTRKGLFGNSGAKYDMDWLWDVLGLHFVYKI